MKTLVLNLGTMDADAVLCGGQSAILRRIMPAGCQPGMRVIFHHNGFMVGEAVIAAACTDTAENIATRFATAAWKSVSDAAELLDGARHPGAIILHSPQRYEPARPWRGIQPLGHLYI